jgi:hypothetical protein
VGDPAIAGAPCRALRSRPVPAFLLEFFLPDAQAGAAIAARVRQATAAVAADGVAVRLHQLVAMPAGELCLCLFDAPSPEDVEAISRRAGLPREGRPEPVELLEA